MKLADIIHKIAVFFAGKKAKKRDYSVKTANICFRDIPYSAYLVIKKYGWVIFFYKSVDFLKKFPWECVKKIKYLYRQVISSLRGEGFGKMILRMLNYIFYGKGVLSRKEIIRRGKKFRPEVYNINLIDALVIHKLKEICFKEENNPKVSIIIPVFNKWKFTYNCLDSLKKNIKSIAYEVIVVDDGSIDETEEMIKKIKNVVYIKNEKNLGFVGSCNAGAKKAKGKYVVFLNNDTSVKKDWLSSLLETFRNNKNIGLAGSKLIYPDERLQEAGGIVWKNKNVWNYGRYQNPNDPEFNYLKDVDYCSGASIMLPKDVFEKLGGFDVIFSPGYCEDTDLAFRVRQLGLRTVYQPKSELFHFEGITAGIDSSKGMKKYQEINKKKFFKRWKDVLEKENLDDSSDGPFLARDRSKNKKILLFIDYQVPSFDKDAGSVRMFEYLKIFLELGFKIVFWPDNLHKSEPYTEILQQMGIEAVYGQQSFENYIKQFGNYFDIAYLSRPLAINYIPYLNKFSRAKIIYDCQDLHFIREKRRGELEKDPAILKQAEEIKEIELTIMRNSSAVVVLSDKEKEILEEIDPNINVAILPYIQSAQDITKNFASKKDIIFIGGFNHKPNEDAVVWFIENIFPLIKKNITEARFIILGSNPTETITKLKSEDIIVTGFIKNIDPYFQNAKVFVAPIRYGAGLKGKIIHAMSFGLPIVTTSIGAEGMNLAKNEIVKVADNPKDFAKKVIELYLSNELWKVYSDKALDFVKINNGPLFAKEKIKELINRI